MLGKVALVVGILLCATAVLHSASVVVESVGEETPVWLGVLIDDESLDGGVLLMAVIPGGPAAIGGLQRGDLLLEVDGRGLVRTADLEAALALSTPGDRLSLKVLRAGSAHDRTVTLTRRPSGTRTWSYVTSGPTEEPVPAPLQPSAPRPPSRAAAYGFVVADVTPDLRTYYGAPEEAGVLVTEVSPGRAAHRAGLRVGDVLVQLGSVEVRHAVEVDDLLPADATDKQVVEARVVRENRPTVARLAVPELQTWPARPASLATDVQNFEALERAIQLEIDRLTRRLGELEERLEQLHEAREAKPER